MNWPKDKCFWCDTEIIDTPRLKRLRNNSSTQDHFVSKALKDLMGKKLNNSIFHTVGGRKSCRCCNACNGKRATISGVLGSLLIIRNKLVNGNLENSELSGWYKARAQVIEYINFFRPKIKKKLPRPIAELCLKELDELI